MIKADNLVKKYGDLEALSDVSFELKKGEIVGILGPNGAGKTTLLRMLVTFLEPTSGNVTLDGFSVKDPVSRQKIRARIGYLPEHAPLYEEMTVTEYLEFVGRMQGLDEDALEKRFSYVVEKCGLKDKKKAEIYTLSKGYRQRVGLAQALIHNPDIIILDEPTTGLDPNQRIEIRDLIKEIGKSKTVILSSHVLPEVQATCSRILIINKGKIVADGAPKDLEDQGRRKTVINIEVENIGSNLVSKLKALAGVKEVVVQDKKITVTTDLEKDLRSLISETVVSDRSGLLEINQMHTGLEEIFINLTAKEHE